MSIESAFEKNMNCFFVTASYKEASGIMKAAGACRKEILGGIEFYLSESMQGVGVAVLGIAKVSFAIGTQLIIDHFRPKVIFSLGFAGSLSQELGHLRVVIGSESFQYDVCSSRTKIVNLDCPQYRRLKRINAPMALIENTAACLAEFNPYVVPIATGDNFFADEELAARLREQYGVLAADQETAAFYQACHYSDVEGIAVKVITDCCDSQALRAYYANEDEAAQKLVDIYERLLQSALKQYEAKGEEYHEG